MTFEYGRIFYSDESTFNLVQSDGSHYVRQRKGERLHLKYVKKKGFRLTKGRNVSLVLSYSAILQSKFSCV